MRRQVSAVQLGLTLNRIDRYKSEYLWRQMAARNFRLREPASLDFQHEVPTVMAALVKNLTENIGYSHDELATVLHLYYDEIAQLYGLPDKAAHTGLRVVK